jgi:hypothetical protein
MVGFAAGLSAGENGPCGVGLDHRGAQVPEQNGSKAKRPPASAYMTVPANVGSLWEINLDGSGLHRVAKAPQGHRDLWPQYSPDGRFITFVSDRLYRDDCCLDVWRMNADGSGAIPLTSNLTPDGCQDANCVYPAWGAKP